MTRTPTAKILGHKIVMTSLLDIENNNFKVIHKPAGYSRAQFNVSRLHAGRNTQTSV